MPQTTPIAIVGIGCRFPGGATGPDRYWDLVERCADGVRDVPADRWPASFHDPDPRTPGTSYASRAGYLDEPGRTFDAGFFGISPREAETLDPQQRLLLEVGFEAIEDAGLRLEALRGSRTGVFVGGFTLDNMLLRFADLTAVDSHTATSSSMTVLSNRLSYTFDLRGPSMTVDTACSSSLVATHLACRALADGTCDLALAGGVNVMLLPNFQVVMCKGRFLAMDGRSKAFDADADGYGRGEGAGVVVLKRLDRALADGDRIYAVLRGTGVNQDGATDGMPQPSGEAQAELFREVCEAAGVDPASIGYVEAHGTGTALGDPIEVGALGSVYGRPGDPGAPRLGSVKPNIGHLEAAAGIAGLIKATLAVHHGVVPPHWRPGRVNPALRLDDVGLVLPEAASPWAGPSRRAAVNSFGYGGTNAHALLEPAPEVALRGPGRFRSVPVSAADAEGLMARAAQLEGLPPAGLAGTLAHHRSHLAARAVVLADDVVGGLRALAEGRPHPSVIGPAAPSASTAWLFTGMGPQWWAMGAELHAADPAFREGMEAALDALQAAGCDLRPELFLERERSRMPRNDVAQPANFVVQVGLVHALRAAGLAPDLIIGHSTGEMAAAWTAGALSLEHAAHVVAVRARLQQEVAGGGMLAVGAGADAVQPHLDAIGGLEIAAYNAATSVTVAGDLASLGTLADALDAEGVWNAKVRVQVAYHSAHMDPVRQRMLDALASVRPQAPEHPLVSTVTGQRVDGPVHDAAYWWANTRGAVRLADALATALEHGVDTVVEVGPHPVLASSVQAASRDAVPLFAMKRLAPEAETFHRLVAELHVRGATVRPEVFAEPARLDLPAYPWQRQRLWREHAALPQERGWRLDTTANAWLRDHVVKGTAILPGAAYVEMVRRTVGDATVVMSDLVIERALALETPGTVQRLEAERHGDTVVVTSRTGDGAPVVHARARVEEARRWRAPQGVDLPALRDRCPTPVAVDGCYADFAARGLAYGPAFQGLSALWRGEGEVLARIEGEPAAFGLHPALLDAAFQALLGAGVDGRTMLPVGIDRVHVDGALPGTLWVHGRVRSDDGDELVGDLELADAEGCGVARVVGLRCRRMATAVDSDRWWHGTAWVPAATEGPALMGARRTWTAPATVDPVGADLVAALLDLVRACVAEGVGLDVCTRGALPVDGVGGDPAQAAVWGLARVARTEHPALGLRLIDLDPRGDAPGEVAAALAAGDGEEEVALRGGVRRVARLRAAPPVDPAAELTIERVAPGTTAARLVVGRPGELDTVVFVPTPRVAPGPGEVEIEVEAAPLNFKDVMKAMGMLDEVALESSYLGTELGMEAVGRVVRTGPGCERAVGDRVLVYRGGALRTHVVADERFVVPCPERWSVGEAASFFVTVTAWHALVDVARLQPGETVLVQSAAGGVGLAAVGIAQRLGCEVVATAGTEAKREALRALGVERVHDSRTLDWADEVGTVDVVLNALGGRAIDLGLRCLAPGGRFVELGKRDLAEGRPVSLRAFNRRSAFLAVDLDRAAAEAPDAFPVLARTVLDELASGRLPCMPAEVHAGGDVVDAFRSLGSGALLGKTVVRLKGETLPLAPALARAFAPTPGRPWLVTGGLGGFGLATAVWLADQGVTHLVLASRRGAARGEEAAVVDALRDRVRVDTVALDVTDGPAVHALVASLPDLAGVVHAAAVLDDAPLDRLSSEALARVMGAKARGAWHLHAACGARALEAFVLYSSIAAGVGNPGQGAYGAANLALEGLCGLRRGQGLAATTVAWGALDEVGMVARDAATRAHLGAVGLHPMPPMAALDALGEALAEGRGALALVDIDWTTWVRAHAAVPWRRLEDLAAPADDGGRVWTFDEALVVLAEAAAPVFGLDVARVDAVRPLRDLGLDSLMAVELAAALGRASGMEVSAMDLLGGRSLTALARQLAAAPEAEAAPAPETAEALRARVLLTAPYDRLEAVVVDGDTLRAEVAPDVLDADLGPIAAAEAGRHLAILGSLAAVRRNPDTTPHEYAVAEADLVIDAVEGPPAERVRLEARCTGFDRVASQATAEGALYALDGRRLATLTVRYHVLPVRTLRALHPERVRPVEALAADDPYRRWTAAPVRAIEGDRVVTGLDRVPAAACAGHFPGLPALPVSILGREVFAAVAAARREVHGDEAVAVRRARLTTEAWVWADEPVAFVATADGRCEVRSGDTVAATFQLECAPMRARAHRRASHARAPEEKSASTVLGAAKRVA